MTRAIRRAAVLIGVDRSGHLPALTDAAGGARRMETWLADQGLADHQLIVLTDEGGRRVTADDVLSAITTIVDADDRPDQLIVYFAGHGISKNYSEYWLLSDAPRNVSAAVDVAGSEVVARYCGIPHVVFISDACRTAADGVLFQRVNGSVVFPNATNTVHEGAIDQFFACGLGQAAAEVRGPEQFGGSSFNAIYTEALVRGLTGYDGVAVDWSADGTVGYVRPRPLKSHLSRAVQRRIDQLGLLGKVNQIPDARITSDSTAWVSVFRRRADASEQASLRVPGPNAPKDGSTAKEDFIPPPSSILASELRLLLQEALLLQGATTPEVLNGHALLGMTGVEIAEVFGRDVKAAYRIADGSMALELSEGFADVVAVTLSGLVVQVPIVAGRRNIATCEKGQMLGMHLATESDRESTAARQMRGRVRNSTWKALRAGAFEWSVEDIPLVLEYLARDPYDLTLIVYVSTMLDGLRQPSSLNVLAELAQRHWKHLPIDLEMHRASAQTSTVFDRFRIRSLRPSLPCLSRNWSRLTAFANDGADVVALRNLVNDAPWSSFSTDAIPLLRQFHSESSAL